MVLAPLARRPIRFADLLYPRFVVPVIFWIVAFFPAIYLAGTPQSASVFDSDRVTYQNSALAYLILCLAAFWMGFLIPLRIPALSRLTANLSFQFDSAQLRRSAMFVSTLSALYLTIVQGPSLFDQSWGGPILTSAFFNYINRFIILPMNLLAVIAYGLGWPAREEGKGFITWAGAIYILVLASLPLISTFSRGSGLMPVLMLIGYIGRWRRLPIRATLLVLFVLIYAAHVGLSGRGVYGHYSGVIPYAKHFFSGAGFSLAGTGDAIGAGDSLTPLCVSMGAASTAADVNASTPLQWLIFQIPVPHIYGVGGHFTLDLARYVGGEGSWGYTPTMFGDTFIHLGWWGCLPFIYVGLLFRLLENTIREHQAQGSFGLIAVTMLPAGYFAFFTGCFNTFRQWNSMFTFGIGLILLSLWAFQKLTSRPAEEWAAQPVG
jgi:hypothetical protein